MLQIALILPGATDYVCQGRIQGSLDMPLNAEGAKEVQQMAAELKPAAVELLYHSDSEPASETATILASALGLKTKKLDKMGNISHGLWQGLLVDEVKRKQPKVYRQWQEQPESICPPEGETLAEARERVQAALAKLTKKHKSGVIGMIVPEPLASVVRSQLGAGELGDLWQAGAAHGQWELIAVPVPTVAHT